jgi:membrane protein involved in colicin uptake
MASPSAAAAAAVAAGSSAVARAAAYTAQQLGEVQAECESLAAQVAATKVVADTGTDAAEQRKVAADTESLRASLEASTQQRDVLLSDLSEHGEPICSDGGGGGGRQPGSGGIHRTAAG